MKIRRTRAAGLAAAALALAVAGPAAANDSIAELRPGGLVFVTTDAISMESEDLFVSEKEVRVAYRFLNTTDKDVTATVAFPMPDIEGNPWVMPAIPDAEKANYLDFEVVQDGVRIEPMLQQQIFVAGIDMTGVVTGAGIPLEPYADATEAAIAGLPEETKKDWIAKGLLVVDTYDDDGSGMKDHYVPFWTLRTTYHWQTTFPAGREVSVEHRYTPSVGGSAGLSFLEEGKLTGDTYLDYKRRYCLDEGFEKTVSKWVTPDNPFPPYGETRVAYVLMTGNNWAGGIKRFKLTVDKGRPDAVVSFCGEGVKKTGPTTFTMEKEDFYPQKDLEVLILNKYATE